MRLRVPVPLRADAYTISSDGFASDECKSHSLYHFMNRISPKEAFPEICKDSRMVMYGLSDFITNCLMDKCTHEDVDESVAFMSEANSFGGGMSFNEGMWRSVVDNHNGYLPITIRSIKEGSTFYPYEPIIAVRGIDGFGELAAHIEAQLVGMVSIATVRATITRHWYDRIAEMAHSIISDEDALHQFCSFFIHDFGMRASSCNEESEMLGRAHLLTFNGTDTFGAAYQARKYGAELPVGTSIPALAHRIVQGHKTEVEAFEALRENTEKTAKKSVASYVADCYNFKRAVEILANLAEKHKDSTFVVRPDSGDPVETVLHIMKVAREKGVGLRFLQGDSVNPTKLRTIFEAVVREYGEFPGIFGIGGWLRNSCTRDSFSSAYKLAKAGERPVIKISETDRKVSVPGDVKLIRSISNAPTICLQLETVEFDRRETYYQDGWFSPEIHRFNVARHFCMDDFENNKGRRADLGLNGTLFSDGVKDLISSLGESCGPTQE